MCIVVKEISITINKFTVVKKDNFNKGTQMKEDNLLTIFQKLLFCYLIPEHDDSGGVGDKEGGVGLAVQLEAGWHVLSLLV